MSGWPSEPMLALDLEATGVDPDNDRIATACAAVVREGVVTYQRDWIIQIDVEMPAEASAVNGLTTEHLRAHGRRAGVVIPEIVGAVRWALHTGAPVVAYNAAFDVTFLDRESRRWSSQGLAEACGVDEVRPVLDPFVIWKQVDAYRRGGRKLTDACQAFDVQLGDQAHEAAADAIAATRVLHRMAARYQQVAGATLDQLHTLQVVWRREQCDSLRAYFDSKGTKHDGVDGSWPLRPYAPTTVGASA